MTYILYFLYLLFQNIEICDNQSNGINRAVFCTFATRQTEILYNIYCIRCDAEAREDP
jgi:hypothetical protein